MEIDRMLTLSTAHICQDTAEKMESHLLDLTIYEKGKYGWFIYVEPETAEKKIPQDLSVVLKIAEKAGCVWICLDCDGAKIENLPVFEW